MDDWGERTLLYRLIGVKTPFATGRDLVCNVNPLGITPPNYFFVCVGSNMLIFVSTCLYWLLVSKLSYDFITKAI